MDKDVIGTIFFQCLFKRPDAFALAYTNKSFYKNIASLVNRLDLKKLNLPWLTILDVEAYGKIVGPDFINVMHFASEPKINNIRTLKSCCEPVYSEEDNEKFILVTMSEGNNIKSLQQTIDISGHIFDLSSDKTLKGLEYFTTAITSRVLISSLRSRECRIVAGYLTPDKKIPTLEEHLILNNSYYSVKTDGIMAFPFVVAEHAILSVNREIKKRL